MDTEEHAALLKTAMAESGLSRDDIAEAVGRTYRTIGNWISETSPTMPLPQERAILRRLLGPYDTAGDSVERAIRRSELHEWRQDAVLSVYKRNLHEQREDISA